MNFATSDRSMESSSRCAIQTLSTDTTMPVIAANMPAPRIQDELLSARHSISRSRSSRPLGLLAIAMTMWPTTSTPTSSPVATMKSGTNAMTVVTPFDSMRAATTKYEPSTVTMLTSWIETLFSSNDAFIGPPWTFWMTDEFDIMSNIRDTSKDVKYVLHGSQAVLGHGGWLA